MAPRAKITGARAVSTDVSTGASRTRPASVRQTAVRSTGVRRPTARPRQRIYRRKMRLNPRALWAVVGAGAAVFLVVMLGQGMLISVLSENQLQAYQMGTLLTFLPAFLLSGFVFAIPLMPPFLQLASYVVPPRYLVTICKGIYLKGLGLKDLWPSALMLVFFAVFFLALAMRKFRRKL